MMSGSKIGATNFSGLANPMSFSLKKSKEYISLLTSIGEDTTDNRATLGQNQ